MWIILFTNAILQTKTIILLFTNTLVLFTNRKFYFLQCSLCIRTRTSNLKMLLPKTKIVFYCCKTLREIEYNNRKILHSWPIFCEEVFPLWQNYQTIIWSWKMEMAAEGPRGWRFFFRSCTLFKYKRRHEEWDHWIRLGQDRRIARCYKTHF